MQAPNKVTRYPCAPQQTSRGHGKGLRAGACGRAFGLEVAERDLRHRLAAAQRADELHELQHGPDAVRLAAAALLHILACPPARSSDVMWQPQSAK